MGHNPTRDDTIEVVETDDDLLVIPTTIEDLRARTGIDNWDGLADTYEVTIHENGVVTTYVPGYGVDVLTGWNPQTEAEVKQAYAPVFAAFDEMVRTVYGDPEATP